MKICSKCELKKMVSEFYKQKLSEDGVQRWCKVCAKGYSLEHKEEAAAYQKGYRLRNKDHGYAYNKDYYLRNKGKIMVQHRGYALTHKKQRAAHNKKRKGTDINYRLSCLIRNRLGDAIKGSYKSGSAVRDLGCTISELKFYLEGQFQDGMTWDNRATTGWHIDHKIPLAFFNLADREQFLQAVHYTNLQPMWGVENIRKGKKIEMVL